MPTRAEGHEIPGKIWLSPPPAARRTLSRDAIVGAGIRVADAGGTEALTMAAVAAELGSYTAMALYRYVGSKDGLVDLMLDRVVDEIAVPTLGRRRWRAVTRAMAVETWEMACRHPWYAQLVHTRPPLGPHTLRRTEGALGVLTSTGLGIPEALGYLALVDRHVFSSAVVSAQEQAMARRFGIEAADELAIAIQGLQQEVAARGDYPLLSAWMASPEGLTDEEQLLVGLDFILDGIAKRVETALGSRRQRAGGGARTSRA